MKRFIAIALMCLGFVVYAQTYKVTIEGKGSVYIILEDGTPCKVESGDEIDENDLLSVPKGAYVVVYVKGNKRKFMEGVYTLKDKLNQ